MPRKWLMGLIPGRVLAYNLAAAQADDHVYRDHRYDQRVSGLCPVLPADRWRPAVQHHNHRAFHLQTCLSLTGDGYASAASMVLVFVTIITALIERLCDWGMVR